MPLRSLFALVVSLLAATATTTAVHAAAVYDYRGNLFYEEDPSAGRVVGTLTLDEALVPSLGRTSLVAAENLPGFNLKMNVEYPDGGANFINDSSSSGSFIAEISTDESGRIDEWHLSFFAEFDRFTISLTTRRQTTRTASFDAVYDRVESLGFTDDNSNNSGEWTFVPPAPVPLPPAFLSLAGAVAGLSLLGRRMRAA